ncbi:Transcriptional activator HAP2 [Orchesella cincta]|uniref:Nuclear transcription factor Y subunit n=1 Tax=Orchesella cincta TaxID=48709 RepID=A0A1D2MSI2_ORCCI|nr:Transcriptional activator HAP2 [Orchesella cincta]
MPNIQEENQPEGVSSSSSEPPPAQVEVLENPVFVNSKQYLRILQRRVERARLQDKIRDKERVKYLHESRHLHAANRVRGQGGRFQTGSTKGKKRSGTRRKRCSLLL